MRGRDTAFRLLFGGLLLLVVAAEVFADGTQTGIITGAVVDTTGTALQGVQVKAAGPQIQRTAFTDPDGRFRFPALGVGSYEVTAELLGLTASQTAVAVYINKTTELRLELMEEDEASLEEPAAQASDWIQVIAEAPVIDRFDTSVGASISFDFLDELPVERFYQSVALVLPGVAGGEDGNPNVSGSLRNANLFLIDGVDTTDPTTGLFGLNLAYEAVEAVDVATAAPSSEYGRFSGAVINVVTRSGGNEFEGSVRLIATNSDWNSPYDFPSEETAHLAPDIEAANSGPEDINPTLALTLGGPLVVEHLWFFGAYEDAQASFLRPTLQGTVWDEAATLEDSAFKLTWQATQGNTLVAQHTADSASFAAFAPFQRGPIENRATVAPGRLQPSVVDPVPGEVFSLEEQSQEGDFTKLQWNSALNQNLSLGLTLAQQERRLERRPLNSRGFTAGAPHVAAQRVFIRPGQELEPEILDASLWNGIPDRGFEERPREQGNLALNWFTQVGALDHELKTGVDFQETESERFFNFAGQEGIDRATGLPVDGQLFLDVDFRDACLSFDACLPFNPVSLEFRPFVLFNFWQRQPRLTREETRAVYFDHSISLTKWLFSFGGRFESIRGEDDGGAGLVRDEDLAPRLSLTYDPQGDGSVLFSATYGRFFEPFLQQYLDTFGRIDLFSGFTEYLWGGLFDARCREEDPSDIASPCWVAVGSAGFVPVQSANPNTSLERSSVDELVLGFERQLSSSTALSLHFIERRWNDLWDDVLRVRFGGEDAPTGFVSFIGNFEQARRRYKGIQFLLQKRYAENWQLLGSYTWSEAEGNLFQNDGLAQLGNFANLTDVNLTNRFGFAPYDRRHRLRVYANYQIPLRRFNVSLGNVLRFESGLPFERQAFEEFGIRFLTPRGSERLSDVFQWDLSVGLDVRLGSDLELDLKAEVFNLTNEGETLAVDPFFPPGVPPLPRSLAALQAPRNYRLTVGLGF